MNRLFWITAFFLFSLQAKADFLFINLNDAAEEIKYAQKALANINKIHAQKGEPLEELVVVPEPLPPAEARKLNDLNFRLYKLNKTLQSECKITQAPSCQELESMQNKLEQEKKSFLEKTKFNAEVLQKALAKQQEKKRDFRSLIISGHDGTGTFSGVNGNISDAKLGEIFLSYPLLSANLTTIYAWGCYTANPGAIDGMWKKNFPNLLAVFGYDYKGAKKDAKAGLNYLQNMMEKEEKAYRAKNAKELQDLLKTIKGYQLVKPAISVCDMYATPTEASTLTEIKKDCASKMSELKKIKTVFDCYARAKDENCYNPPENTSVSKLREYYELLQSAQICEQVAEYEAEFRSLSKDQTIRLIFYRNIVANLQNNYQKEFLEVDKTLEQLGASSALRFGSVKDLSRHDLMMRVELLNDFLIGQEHIEDKPLIERAQLSMLFNFRSAIISTAVNLGLCVPFNWVEPNAIEESHCLNNSRFGDENVQKTLKNPEQMGAGISSLQTSIGMNKLHKLRIEAIKNPTDVNRAAFELADAEMAWNFAKKENASFGSLADYKSPNADVYALRLKRAERLKQLAALGLKDITKDPESVNLALQYNIGLIKNSKDADSETSKKKLLLLERRLELENPEITQEGRELAKKEIGRIESQMSDLLYQEKLNELFKRKAMLSVSAKNSHSELLDSQFTEIYEKEIEQIEKEIDLMHTFKERYASGLSEKIFLRPMGSEF